MNDELFLMFLDTGLDTLRDQSADFIAGIEASEKALILTRSGGDPMVAGYQLGIESARALGMVASAIEKGTEAA